MNWRNLPQWVRWGAGGAVGVLSLAIDGTLVWWVPGALIHLLYLPALYATRGTGSWLLLLATAEWGLSRVPLGAAFSTAATVYFLYRTLREEVNTETYVPAFVIIPGIEVIRFLWAELYAALYRLPPLGSFPWAHTLLETAAGVVLLFALTQGWRRRQRMKEAAWP